MNRITKTIDKYLYPDYQDCWDVSLFRKRIDEYLRPGCKVLDLGAGGGATSINLKDRAGYICGIDPDERVLQNPYLDEAKVASAESIPYSDDTFDMVICLHVLEHLRQPAKVFREVNRVLRPNGIFLIKTPNKYHYVPLLGRITPERFHKSYNKMRSRNEQDTFATYYRANSKKTIEKLAKSTGFIVEKTELIEGRPEYLRIIWPAYLVGALYERVVNSSDIFKHLRVVMLVTLRKINSDSLSTYTPAVVCLS
jgi:ubiquinone/menaquinone biosynthesis C-methylase UbiE